MGRFVEWIHSWRLLSWRSALVALFVLYAVIGFLVVPPIAKKLIVDTMRERTGREVAVESVRCNPFTLSLTVRGFSMPDRPGSTILSFDELYVNAQLSSLFRWAGTLKELRVSNPYVGLRRFVDGKINVVELMDEVKRRATVEPEAGAEDDEALDLPRVVLQHILVTGTTLDLEDRAREEPFALELGPSRFELHDISTLPGRKGDNEFAIGLKRGGTISIAGDVEVEPLSLEGNVSVDKIFLENAWPLLKPYFEFDLVAGRAAGRFHYTAQLLDDGLHARIEDLDYEVSGIEVQLRDSDTKVVEVTAMAIADGHFTYPEGNVGAASVEVDGASAFLWLEPDGAFGWEALVPQPTQEQVVTTYHQVEKALPWVATVGRFEVRTASARFEDRTFDEPVSFTVGNANLVLTDVTTEPGGKWNLSSSALLPGGAPASAEGSIGVAPVSIDVQVGVSDLELAPFQHYVERYTPLELVAGTVESSGRVRFAPGGEGPLATFAGDAKIAGIDLRERIVGSRLLHWGSVEIREIEAAHGPQSAQIAGIDIRDAGIEVVLSEEGKVNLIELFAAMAGESGEPEAAEASAESTESKIPLIKIGAVALHGCSGAYTDRTLAPPFTLALDELDGTVEAILSTSESGAKLELGGVVRSGGIVEIDGEIDLFDPKRLADLSIDVREADMPPFTPMAVRYLGHPVERGKVDVGLDYDIVDNQLNGQNHFVTQDLTLGEKVEGQGTVNLPIKLGVSLLTDKNGRIDLDFPVEGDLSDPEFGLGGAIGSAAKEVMGQLVKSPFRLLGKLGGGKEGQDYRFVEFKAGSAELEVTSEGKLRTLAAGADQRPELILQVSGVWEPGADTPALQEAMLEELLAQRMAESGTATEEVASAIPMELLESLYRESSPATSMEQLRAQFTIAADSEGQEPVLDEPAYRSALRQALVAAQAVDEIALRNLGTGRAEAIRAFLVDDSGISAARVRLLGPKAIEPADDRWVRLELDVIAGE